MGSSAASGTLPAVSCILLSLSLSRIDAVLTGGRERKKVSCVRSGAKDNRGAEAISEKEL